MSEKINSKGGSDVNRDSGATILHTPNMFDVSMAETARGGKGDWDDFQLMGSSDAQERSYSAPEDTSETKEILARIREKSLGKRIMKMDLSLDSP